MNDGTVPGNSSYGPGSNQSKPAAAFARDRRPGVRLTDVDVQTFVDLYKRRTGVTLGSIEARRLASTLLSFVRVLLTSELATTKVGEPMGESEQHK